MQVVGLSSPDISAVAPDGVDEIEMFSVVPRVTEAQPMHGDAIAAAKSNLIIGKFPCPRKSFTQPQRECKGAFAIALGTVNAARSLQPRAHLRLATWRECARRHFLSSSVA
jgi:hypothetical protein